MGEVTQSGPGRLRVALDHGEVVELDGGTLVLDGGEEVSSVVLRLAPWRARSIARVLEEWSAVARAFHRPPRPRVDELDLSLALELAASALGEDDEPLPRLPRGGRAVPSGQRLAAVAALAERQGGLSAVQRLAVVDAAAWWLTDEAGGQELAHALFAAVCSEAAAAEHAYLALITPMPHPGDQPEDTPS